MTIPEGAKVKVTHLRYPDFKLSFVLPGDLYTAFQLKEWGLRPSAKGGMTLVQLELPDGLTVRAKAVCSRKDNFCKATGRAIALGRALKAAA